MSQQFTPNTPKFGKDSNPRDWAYELGSLSQDASIVFTKASLVAWLKTQAIEVSPSYGELKALPKFATIGSKMTDAAPAAATSASQEQTAGSTVAAHSTAAGFTPLGSEPAAVEPLEAPRSAPTPPKPAVEAPVVRTADGDVFRPTRRVREAVGGGSAQIGALFGDGDEEDALAEAARESARRRGLASANAAKLEKENADAAAAAKTRASATTQQQKLEQEQREKVQNNGFRPTRRVREPVGGGSEQINALFGGGD